jgi:hypothetical protein
MQPFWHTLCGCREVFEQIELAGELPGRMSACDHCVGLRIETIDAW